MKPKSKYIPNLPTNATVSSFKTMAPFEPREAIFCQNPPPSLLQLIDNASEVARNYGIQRPAADWRVDHYEKEIAKGELKTLQVAVVQFRDGKKLVLATEDGAHKCRAALQKGFKGVLVLLVFQVDTLDNARVLASKFDSRVGARSYANTIMYVYGANTEYSVAHIKFFTSAMLHLLVGTPGEDPTMVAESFPLFSGKLKVHDFWNVSRAKASFEPILKWFFAEFRITRDAKSKLYNQGVLTAMLHSYIVYGPEVKAFWQRYITGSNIEDGSALQRLRDLLLSGRGGGKDLMLDNYRLAVWAFLSETGRHNMAGTTFSAGRPYHVKYGYQPGFKPSKRNAKGTQQVRVSVAVKTEVAA